MAEELKDGLTAQVITLGGVLRSERQRRLLAITQVALLAGVDVDTIRAVERDEHELTPSELDAVMHHYQEHEWSTQRGLGELTVDLNKGIVSFSTQDSSRVLDDAADRVLARYILLLYRHRGLEVGTKIPVKDIDLMVLRSALSVRKPQVERHIRNLQSQRDPKLLAVERPVQFAVGGLAVVAIALGVAVLSSSNVEPDNTVPNEAVVIQLDDPPGAGSAVAPGEVPEALANVDGQTVEIGEAVSIVRPPNDSVELPGE